MTFTPEQLHARALLAAFRRDDGPAADGGEPDALRAAAREVIAAVQGCGYECDQLRVLAATKALAEAADGPAAEERKLATRSHCLLVGRLTELAEDYEWIAEAETSSTRRRLYAEFAGELRQAMEG